VATIRERRPGVFEVRAFTGMGSRGQPTQVSKTVHGTKRDALRVAAQMTATPPGYGGGRTVEDVLQTWVDLHSATWAPSTSRDNASRVAQIGMDPVAKVAVSRLTVADVERWHARLRASGMGDGAILNRHRTLRAALTQALRWGWVSANVAGLARLNLSRRPPRGAISEDEVRLVLKKASEIDPAAGLALRLAAVTGARRAELAALRWSDLEGNRLTIDSSVVTIRTGTKAEPRHPTFVDSSTKTANVRTVTLDPVSVHAIGRLRQECSEYGQYMFWPGDVPPDPDRIGSWWRAAREASGIDPSWRLHDLRHWSATVAIGHGHDVRTVANRLGHANAAMTLRVYAHALESADKDLATTLGQILPSG
jgi:integrase